VLKESGDVILSEAKIYAEIGEIFAGTKPSPASQTTIFKSVGIAVEDIVTANLVFKKHLREKRNNPRSAPHLKSAHQLVRRRHLRRGRPGLHRRFSC